MHDRRTALFRLHTVLLAIEATRSTRSQVPWGGNKRTQKITETFDQEKDTSFKV